VWLRRIARPLLIVVLIFLAFRLGKPYADARNRGKGAQLRKAVLVLAPLAGADLSGANLAGANLSGAHLESSDLRDANLRGANLTNANLAGADLRGADLREASLRRAVLSDADFRSALMHDVDLSYGMYNTKTRWPIGFKPTAAGAKPMAGIGADDLGK